MNDISDFRFLRDLGDIDGPILVFGGPLSNLEALDALLDEARARGIDTTRMICTGDVAGYCADPEPCLTALHRSGIATVMGNVEEALGADADDCGCNFVEGSTCDALAARWYDYARKRVSGESRTWMRGLPRQIAFRLGGRDFLATHGGFRRINRYVFESDAVAIADELDMLNAPCAVIAGHTGLPFTTRRGPNVWHNAGSLGLPANDGTPRVWCSLLEESDGVVRFEHVPLAYSHETAARKMREAGLPEVYADTLTTGLWPDTAILPEAETRATGTALAPAPLIWT